MTDTGAFVITCATLALLIVVSIVWFHDRMARERADAARRARERVGRQRIDDRRLARLHVIESDPARFVGTTTPTPKETDQ